jgi:hypothetical protein
MYVQYCQTKGFSRDQITNNLVKAGWKRELIDIVFRNLGISYLSKPSKKPLTKFKAVSPNQLKKLREFIDKARKKDYENNQIKQLFIKSKWSDDLINVISALL